MGKIPEMPPPNRKPLRLDYFDRDALDVARSLIGVSVFVNGVGGVIIETEAYDETDSASHCFEQWRSVINESMYLPGGHAYVCPGRHFYNLNFVCREAGFGSAVLIRALLPDRDSVATMRERRDHFYRRGVPKGTHYLCGKPGPLCEALAVGARHDGLSLYSRPFELFDCDSDLRVEEGPRIGITSAKERKWRFWMPAVRLT
jgi:DNA-3-methyladenine glycosylase